MISDAQGEQLVFLARKAVTEYLKSATIIDAPDGLNSTAGVFVTLNYLTTKREERLRGCMGFALPDKVISESVVEAAIAAATADPRFPPVDLPEMSNIIFELSVLTPPVELAGDRNQIRDSIKMGRDGLILRWKHGSGLLLPQVPVDLKWTLDEFLANLCYKAGAAIDVLEDPTTKLFSFGAI
ncbi:MAG: TIGR00296 family protein, partial [Nitrososphaera sp.]